MLAAKRSARETGHADDGRKQDARKPLPAVERGWPTAIGLTQTVMIVPHAEEDSTSAQFIPLLRSDKRDQRAQDGAQRRRYPHSVASPEKPACQAIAAIPPLPTIHPASTWSSLSVLSVCHADASASGSGGNRVTRSPCGHDHHQSRRKRHGHPLDKLMFTPASSRRNPANTLEWNQPAWPQRHQWAPGALSWQPCPDWTFLRRLVGPSRQFKGCITAAADRLPMHMESTACRKQLNTAVFGWIAYAGESPRHPVGEPRRRA